MINNHNLNSKNSILLDIRRIYEYSKKKHYCDFDQWTLRNKVLLLLMPILRTRISYADLIFAFLDRMFYITKYPIFYTILGVKPIQNPKTISLYIISYVKLAKKGFNEYLHEAIILGKMLESHLTFERDFAYLCAPYSHIYDINYPNVKQYTKKHPNTLLSCLAGKAFIDLYSITDDNYWLSLSEKIGLFFMKKFSYHQCDNDSICYKYVINADELLVHNTNTAAASFLLKLSTLKTLNSKKYAEKALSSLSFTLSEIESNGKLAYFSKLDPRYQSDIVDNYHTGFVIIDLIDINFILLSSSIRTTILKMLNFYSLYFDCNGRPRRDAYRLYPINIHDASVGVITYIKGSLYYPPYENVADKILKYIYKNLLNNNGLFIYELSMPYRKNSAVFLRWNLSWMLYALTLYLDNLEG